MSISTRRTRIMVKLEDRLSLSIILIRRKSIKDYSTELNLLSDLLQKDGNTCTEFTYDHVDMNALH